MGRCSGCYWVCGGVAFVTSLLCKIYTTLLQGKMLRRKRRKKALLIGINYNHAPDMQLIFPQRDMMEMYALLKGEVISQGFVRFRH